MPEVRARPGDDDSMEEKPQNGVKEGGILDRIKDTVNQSAAAENLDFIKKGCFLTKVRDKSSTYQRFYRMDDDFISMTYQSKKAKWRQGNTTTSPSVRAQAQRSRSGYVLISQIQEIRDGPLTDVFVKSFKKLSVGEDQCFSLVTGEKYETLDLVAESKEVKDRWVKGLKHLLKRLSEADLSTQQTLWMREIFKVADKDNDNSLTLKEILNLLKVLNICVDYETAQQVFIENSEEIARRADTDKTQNDKGEDCLNLEEFMVFYHMLTARKEIEQLFHKYNYEGQYLDAAELQDFFSKEEHTNITVADCESIIQLHEPCPKIKQQGMMSIDGFYGLFNSETMNLFNPRHRAIYQDMSQPLSHYFIDSSHNTYLTADQLVGDSAVEAYIRALKLGCRCVELDCWDGDKDDPVIYHGHTFTSKILFKDVIYAINMYAFEASEYPVILSIENHCGVEQQKLMAYYMKEIFGDKLFMTPIPDHFTALPSPADLKRKILVKGKKLSEKAVSDEDVSDEDEAAEMPDEQVQKSRKQKKKETKQKLAKELSDCVVICQSVHFIGFLEERDKYNFKQMSSFSEGKAEELVESQPVQYVEHNKWQISRIYPGGLRTDSSNYNPVPMWLTGCQIVALNYQTPDDPMQLNTGRFVDNGSCGYVLKPEFMRTSASETKGSVAGCEPEPEAGPNYNPVGPYPPKMRRKLRLKVISGYQLPKKKGDKAKSILDPFVQVDVIGVPADNKTVKTKHIHNNGFHPVWEEKFEFEVNVPELALIRFQVMDYEDFRSNVQVAQACMPFMSIQPGYRVISLRSKYGEEMWGASLFVHAIIT